MIIFVVNVHAQQKEKHSFALSKNAFLLDGKPFQIIGGEIHPFRIPKQYWRHRIQMAKAMGCNTIALYVFWNYLEIEPNKYDFISENRDIAAFIKICKEENMWVLFRPGPYACGEWDLGGIPPYLLSIPDIKLRCMDSRYMLAAENYIKQLAHQIAPLQCTNGGPILMVQIENEYGSFGNDKNYLETLRKLWLKNGIVVPFYNADGATPYMLEAGHIKGIAIGLDSGGSEADFDEAKKVDPDVPSFSSESYPGWLTHWGEKWARPDTAEILKEVKFLLDTKRSFNLYVVHGGTNFGYTAGANSGDKGYEPDITSYDYDAPINERGEPTPKYFALRNLIAKYVGALPNPPTATPVTSFDDVVLTPVTSIWEQLPKPKNVVQPQPMESFKQYAGCIIYKTTLIGHKSGNLMITDLHDYATIFLDGVYIGKIDRRLGEKSITLPKTNSANPVLEIFVEAMGHINFAQYLIDRKGITDRVTLNGMTLMNWQVYNLPMDEKFITKDIAWSSSIADNSKPGKFFKGVFNINNAADTYIEMKQFKKGIVWVNGHNLGRYWEIGPQHRLYCPAEWLKKGNNDIVIFDLHQIDKAAVSGHITLD